jgi:outer membrane protein OmpA-like peptidoglycan-associated protein
VAALPPDGNVSFAVRFAAGSTAMSAEDESRLKRFAEDFKAGEDRVQLRAYADDSGGNASKARRLSLSRALSVRSFLIENGLRSTRIDVRALGVARDGGPADRVDVIRLQR